MGEHRLHREIITTVVINDMVDRSGITFAFRLNEETGASVPDITAAWLVARNVFDMSGFWALVEGLDGNVDASVQVLLMLEGRKLTERAARWLLYHRRPPFDVQATIDFFAAGGSSLKGVELAGKVSKEFGIDVDLVTVYLRPEFSQLAEHVAALIGEPR